MNDDEDGPFTIEQKRAKFALDKINKVQEEDALKSKYRSYIERLPAIIVLNGLGQAMAMELASAELGSDKRNNDKKTHEQIYNDIQEWLKHCETLPKDQDLIEWILKAPQSEYIHAQYEILKFIDWLKKFSQAKLNKGP